MSDRRQEIVPVRERSRSRERGGAEHKSSRRRSRSTSPKRRRSKDRDAGRTRRSRSRSQERRPRSRSKSPEKRTRRDDKLGVRRSSRSPGSDADRGRDEKRKRRRSRSASVSTSSEDDRKKRRKEKSRKRSKSRDRKERKKDKKKEKKKKKSGAVTAQWGKYGLINDTDLYNKEQEFRAWLVEERKINPETQTKENTRKEFARFTEDYNTATLPHEKYYNMDNYEHRMNAMRHGELVPAGDESYDPNVDLRAHQSSHKRKVVDNDSYLSREQLLELRRVQNERIEAGKMKLLGMEIKQTMGVRMDGTAFDD